MHDIDFNKLKIPRLIYAETSSLLIFHNLASLNFFMVCILSLLIIIRNLLMHAAMISTFTPLLRAAIFICRRSYFLAKSFASMVHHEVDLGK